MSKKKAINFFEGYKNKRNKEYKWIICVISISIILCALKIALGLLDIKNLQTYIDKNNQASKEAINIMAIKKEENISFNQIKEIYQILEPSNINKFVVNNKLIEVEGVCENLSVLENIKSIDKAKNLTIDSVRKEGTSYIFNLKYNVGDNIEN